MMNTRHLSDRCTHECVDVFQSAPAGAPFDHLFSVLVILHVPDRAKLWTALAANVKPGGSILVAGSGGCRSPAPRHWVPFN
jgi:2-polyprenyl-3-methyl-5-hydroxy-6-metoxy-1,4-benzoquinol methylase